MTWTSPRPPDAPDFGWPGRLRLAWRLPVLSAVVFGGLALHGAMRLIEAPLAGTRRPVTPWLIRAICRGALAILGLGRDVQGTPMHGPGAIVANHASWLDIFVLNACGRMVFVAKSEVAGWPGIGWLARAAGTVFIARRGPEAAVQTVLIADRLRLGTPLVFFPEGTSTDGLQVLAFKSSLFAALHAPDLSAALTVQPASLFYAPPPGCDPRFYGWWGAMPFGPHLRKLCAAPGGGRVSVTFHNGLPSADAPDRKALARACEAAVRTGFEQARGTGACQHKPDR